MEEVNLKSNHIKSEITLINYLNYCDLNYLKVSTLIVAELFSGGKCLSGLF